MRYLLASTVAVVIGLSSFGVEAKSQSIIGSWSGSGTTKGDSGNRGTARCQITYTKGSGSSYNVKADCTVSKIGAISQTASVRKVSSNRYSGTFHNHQHSVSGKFHIVLTGTGQRVTMTSERGTASLQMAKH
jgi:hypothetical protein